MGKLLSIEDIQLIGADLLPLLYIAWIMRTGFCCVSERNKRGEELSHMWLEKDGSRLTVNARINFNHFISTVRSLHVKLFEFDPLLQHPLRLFLWYPGVLVNYHSRTWSRLVRKQKEVISRGVWKSPPAQLPLNHQTLGLPLSKYQKSELLDLFPQLGSLGRPAMNRTALCKSAIYCQETQIVQSANSFASLRRREQLKYVRHKRPLPALCDVFA